MYTYFDGSLYPGRRVVIDKPIVLGQYTVVITKRLGFPDDIPKHHIHFTISTEPLSLYDINALVESLDDPSDFMLALEQFDVS